MSDLVAWLGQIWDEQEKVAVSGKSCGSAHPTADVYHPGGHPDVQALAQIAADRQILADYLAEVAQHREHWERQRDRPVSDLHAERAHPDYEYATTEGQRKAWDDANVPPIDRETWEPEPGWERNVDEGRNGWERLEYTEESYWRRLLPESERRGPFVPPVPRHIKHLASAYADRPGYEEAWKP